MNYFIFIISLNYLILIDFMEYIPCYKYVHFTDEESNLRQREVKWFAQSHN